MLLFFNTIRQKVFDKNTPRFFLFSMGLSNFFSWNFTALQHFQNSYFEFFENVIITLDLYLFKKLRLSQEIFMIKKKMLGQFLNRCWMRFSWFNCNFLLFFNLFIYLQNLKFLFWEVKYKSFKNYDLRHVLITLNSFDYEW